MESEEEKKRRELREEADRDTQIAREREETQKRHRDDARRASLEAQVRELENQLSRNKRDLAALELEDSHLESTIKKGYSVSSRESNTLVFKEENEIRTLRSTLDTLHQKERVAEESIHDHERALVEARVLSRTNEDIEDKGRSAKIRQQQQSSQEAKLESDSRKLEIKIQDIKRELTQF